MWFSRKQKKSPTGEERRKDLKARKAWEQDQKEKVSQTLKTVQSQTQVMDDRIETLRKIARLGAVKRQ